MAAETNYVCPVCGAWLPDERSLCSGSFTATDHPANVRAIVGNPPLREPLASPRKERSQNEG